MGKHNLAILDWVGLGPETCDELDERALGAGGSSDRAVHTDGKCREGLEGESGILGWAGGDEGRSDGEDLVEVKGSVVAARPCRILEDRRVHPALMTRLGGENRPGDGEVGLVDDGCRRAEVGRHTDILDHAGEGDERVDVRDRELVRAGLDGLRTESAREE